MLFNIQRWSLHDGPGIRTTLFFKGCPLRCRWCANPESWSFEKQLLFRKDLCTGCGSCVAVCPVHANVLENQCLIHDPSKCMACGNCVQACSESARDLAGMDLAVDEIIRLIERDAVFYRASGGGVTFSGGEPFARKNLLRNLAEALYSAGIRIAVETCGFFVLDEVLDVMDRMDDIFVDLKHTHDSTHRKLTGVSNRVIIENISRLDETGHALTIRVPLVKGLTDTQENMEGLIQICKGLKNLKQVEVLPYHSLGAGKYAGLNLAYDHSMTAPGTEEVQSILNRLHSNGLKACSGVRVGPKPDPMGENEFNPNKEEKIT